MRSIVGALNILFLIGIPIVSIVLLIARLLFGTRMSRSWRLGMTGFWAINMVSLVFVGTNLLRQFSSGTEISDNLDISQITADTISVKVADNPYEHIWFHFGDDMQITDEELITSNIEFHIHKSDGDKVELIQNIYSRGNSLNEAKKLASSVKYPVVIDENGITVPPNFSIPNGQKWRNQRVNIDLMVPENFSVKLVGNTTRHFFHAIDVDESSDFHPWHNENETWTMGENGLYCVSCLDGQEDSQLSYENFSKLKIDGKMKVEINHGEKFDVRLTGRKHYTEKVDLIQMDETLIVSTELEHTSSPIRLYITMPELKSIDTEDTDDIRIQGFKTPHMSMSSRGDYEVKAYIDVDSLSLTQIGRNEVDIRGNCDYLNANLRERARLDAQKINIREVDISATESSRAKLAVVDTIRQLSDERSKITVEGNPSIVIQQQ